MKSTLAKPAPAKKTKRKKANPAYAPKVKVMPKMAAPNTRAVPAAFKRIATLVLEDLKRPDAIPYDVIMRGLLAVKAL